MSFLHTFKPPQPGELKDDAPIKALAEIRSWQIGQRPNVLLKIVVPTQSIHRTASHENAINIKHQTFGGHWSILCDVGDPGTVTQGNGLMKRSLFEFNVGFVH